MNGAEEIMAQLRAVRRKPSANRMVTLRAVVPRDSMAFHSIRHWEILCPDRGDGYTIRSTNIRKSAAEFLMNELRKRRMTVWESF